MPFSPKTTLCLLSCLAAGANAQSILNTKITGKDRNAYACWFSKASFTVRMTAPGTTPPAAPKFTLDLYDEDDVGGDDGRDVDLTETSPTVRVGRWLFRGTAGAGASSWECVITTGGVQEQDVTDPLPGDWPDPRVEIIVTVGTAAPVTVDVAAPGLPPIGGADFGVQSPTAIANLDKLNGLDIAAFSRGLDDISLLPTSRTGSRVQQAALYLSCDHPGKLPASDRTAGPGRMFVLDANGHLWPEDLYGANRTRKTVLGKPRFLNVNTAPVGASVATSEIYFVRKGSAVISYAANGDPAAARPYLNVGTTKGLGALAVEDRAPRGVWSQGDRVLYALEDSAAIYSLVFGGRPSHLTLLRHAFHGTTVLDMSHFDSSLTGQSSLKVGAIRAISVSYPGRNTPEPTGRIAPEVVDHNGLYTFGAPDGGEICFRNSPVLGERDFAVTLRGAKAGTWAMLYTGIPVAPPGLALPPSLSRSKLLLDPASLLALSTPLPTVGGATEQVLPIPNATGLAGMSFGFQWVVFEPKKLPFALSDGGLVHLR